MAEAIDKFKQMMENDRVVKREKEQWDCGDGQDGNVGGEGNAPMCGSKIGLWKDGGARAREAIIKTQRIYH